MTPPQDLPGADKLGEAAPGTPIAWCTHPRAHHTHGSRTAYVLDRCRCPHCREANRHHEQQRRRAQLYGRYDRLVDATPVRNHIHRLMAEGMGWKRVARAAGVANGTVYPILYGKHADKPDHPEHRPPRRRVTRQVADKLLTVQLDLADGALIHQAGTVRRLQALIVCGWSISELGRRLNWTGPNLWVVVHGVRGQVTVATARAVRSLYDELWDQSPPARTRWEKRAATVARRLGESWGWPRPLLWDDDTIDDPYAQPEVDPVGTRRGRVDLDEVQWLLDSGTAPVEIAGRMDLTPAAIEKHARRHGHAALAAVFAAADQRQRRAAA